MKALSLAIATDSRRLAEALVLARSFVRLHPGQTALIAVADASSVHTVDVSDVALTTGRELLGPGYEVLAAALSGEELVRGLLPSLLRRVGAPVLALTPDSEVLATIDLPPGEAVLVFATGEDSVGVVDDGAVAWISGDTSVLDWWDKRVADFEVVDLPGAAAARFADVALVRDPSFAVAAWNVTARGVHDDGGQLKLPGGTPVAWARYEVDAEPATASREPRALDAALLAYRSRIDTAKSALPLIERVGHDLPDGTAIDERLRRLFGEGILANALTCGPFDGPGFEALQQYLDAPADDPRAGGVSRYLFDLWSSRSDLRKNYPDLRDGGDRFGFLGWVAVYGAVEIPVPGWLVPSDRIAEGEQPKGRAVLGVNVAGYFQSELGVGEAARRVVRALDAAHVPLLPVQTETLPAARRGQPFGVATTDAAPFPFNLVCVNADGLPAFAREVGTSFFTGRYTIGNWWWELPDFPARYHGAFEHLDEIWVGTRYIQDALAPVSPVPVLTMPVPVTRPNPAFRSRHQLGLPDGFLVLMMFDFNSVMERKNPLGLMDAFLRAFGADSGASLVIKTANGHLHPRDRLRIRSATLQHDNVHLFERQLTAADRDSLIASCDLYASLHRSEGFGLTLAEAMALERPTMATGWSGNIDFMRSESTHLIPYELVNVGDGNAPYDPESRWANPDLDAAAAVMRIVRDDPAEAGRKARAAAERLLIDHAPEVVGAAMLERLEALAPRVADREALRRGANPLPTEVDEAIARAEDRASKGAEDYTEVGGGLVRKRARAALLKAAQPVVGNQREVDAAVLGALRAVAQRHTQEATIHAALSSTLLSSLRRLEDEIGQLRGRDQAITEQYEELSAAAAELQARQDASEERLRPLVRGAEAIPWTQDEPFSSFDHPVGGRVLGFRSADPLVPKSYREFEEVFRGSRERVRGLLIPYTDLLDGRGPILDVGAGRGELLETLRDAGVESRGVDLDEGMAEAAEANGLNVTVADGVEHLESIEEATLGAVTAIHVIEHLPYRELERFLRAARRALRPGGILVCETINPHAAFALKTFWVDPTHQHPLFPEVTLVLARIAGFESAFVTHIRGTGDVARDRFNEDSYTIVAERAPD